MLSTVSVSIVSRFAFRYVIVYLDIGLYLMLTNERAIYKNGNKSEIATCGILNCIIQIVKTARAYYKCCHCLILLWGDILRLENVGKG